MPDHTSKSARRHARSIAPPDPTPRRRRAPATRLPLLALALVVLGGADIARAQFPAGPLPALSGRYTSGSDVLVLRVSGEGVISGSYRTTWQSGGAFEVPITSGAARWALTAIDPPGGGMPTEDIFAIVSACAGPRTLGFRGQTHCQALVIAAETNSNDPVRRLNVRRLGLYENQRGYRWSSAGDQIFDRSGDAAPPAPSKVTLLGHHGKYVVAESDGKANANRSNAREWETFTLITHPDGRISLRSHHGKYLVAESDGTVNANRSQIADWEKWHMIQHGDGRVSLRSHHGKYLVAESDGTLNANRGHMQDWEKFRMGAARP